jgi:hypothetical protein
VMHEGQAEQIRLLGIDCMRSGSPSVHVPRNTPQSWPLSRMSQCTEIGAIFIVMEEVLPRSFCRTVAA